MSTNQNELDQRLFKHLLLPSISSAAVTVGVPILLIGYVLLHRLYWGTGFGSSLLQTIAASNNNLTGQYQLANIGLVNNALLFVFWATIGAVVYFLVIGLADIAKQTHELEAEFRYVHHNRKAMFRLFLARFATRSAGLALLFGAALLLLKVVLPYVLATAALIAVEPSLVDVFYLLAGFCTFALIVHVIIVLMRAVLLRPRLFGGDILA